MIEASAGGGAGNEGKLSKSLPEVSDVGAGEDQAFPRDQDVDVPRFWAALDDRSLARPVADGFRKDIGEVVIQKQFEAGRAHLRRHVEASHVARMRPFFRSRAAAKRRTVAERPGGARED